MTKWSEHGHHPISSSTLPHIYFILSLFTLVHTAPHRTHSLRIDATGRGAEEAFGGEQQQQQPPQKQGDVAEEDFQFIKVNGGAEAATKMTVRRHILEIFNSFQGQMEKYGYLRGHSSPREFRHALQFFQEVLEVEQSGEIDAATLAAARRPRCVQEDVRHRGRRTKRFSLSKQAKWDVRHFKGGNLHLKWFISEYTRDVERVEIRRVVKKAFELWASQSHIRGEKKVELIFTEAASKEDADINILWAEGEHGDAYEFDGPNGRIDANNRKENVLAHTFYPSYEFPLNGDIHFDGSEAWEIDVEEVESTSGKRFFPYVLAHEIGHSLGLGHSRKHDALMYPYYKNTPLDEIRLDVDDKCGVVWNLSGSSDFCLYVWLMSEIVDAHNSSLQIANGVSPITTAKNGKKSLKNTKIPRCSAHNALTRSTAEEKLMKNLQFTESQARKYTEVVCNFLAGLHMYRAGPNAQHTDSHEKEYRGVQQEMNTFSGTSKTSVKRMLRHAEHLKRNNLPNVFDPGYFDDAFFENFFMEYLN